MPIPYFDLSGFASRYPVQLHLAVQEQTFSNPHKMIENIGEN
jgi:hypothetical protein